MTALGQTQTFRRHFQTKHQLAMARCRLHGPKKLKEEATAYIITKSKLRFPGTVWLKCWWRLCIL